MKKRVLFLCIGNICRSPMAEAMARKYGSDVVEASSAGLSAMPAHYALTQTILKEKNVDLPDYTPRQFVDLDLRQVDLIVNISGRKLPANLTVPVEGWDVQDPYGGTEDDFRAAREKLEMLVMNLILRIRSNKI